MRICVGLIQVAGVCGATGRSAAVNVEVESRRVHAPVNHHLRRRTCARVFWKKAVPAMLSHASVSCVLGTCTFARDHLHIHFFSSFLSLSLSDNLFFLHFFTFHLKIRCSASCVTK